MEEFAGYGKNFIPELVLDKNRPKYILVLITLLMEKISINKGVYRHIGLGPVCRETPFF
jgi:hypothetical protein